MTAPAVTIARKDLRRALTSRSLILTAVVGPLVLGLILALAFGGSGPSATIAVVDRDGSPASEAVVDGLRRNLAETAIRIRSDVDDPRTAVTDEQVDAAVVIPPGYSASLAGDPASLEVIRNADRAIAGEIASSIADQVRSRADLVRVAAGTALAAGAGPPDEVIAAAQGVEPAVVIDVSALSDRFDAPLYFGPLTIFLFLGMGTAARGLVREQRDGQLTRVRAAPVSARSIVTGSALGVFVQGLVASLTVYAVSSVVFRANWGRPVDVVVVLFALVVALSGVSGIIVALSRTEAQAEGWNNACAFLFGILGGAFFGGARFPGALGAIGALTPNGMAMQALVELGPGGQDLGEVVPLLAGLLFTGVVGIAVGSSLMRRRFL
jgi:ABC-2 type transport system permease protein